MVYEEICPSLSHVYLSIYITLRMNKLFTQILTTGRVCATACANYSGPLYRYDTTNNITNNMCIVFLPT